MSQDLPNAQMQGSRLEVCVWRFDAGICVNGKRAEQDRLDIGILQATQSVGDGDTLKGL